MEPRADGYQVQFEAKVTSVADRKQSAVARISNIRDSGIKVDLPFQLAAGDSVELEVADSTLYGRVIQSRPHNSLFRTAIEPVKIVLGGTDLSVLLQRVLLEALPEIPGLEPSEAPLD